MRKQPSNALVVFSAQHIAQALQKVATVPGNFHRPYLYTTPCGTFTSLNQVAAVYNITTTTAKLRFKNFNLPEWTVDRA
jgi:hypothetical protein